jgi:hypothetical protein
LKTWVFINNYLGRVDVSRYLFVSPCHCNPRLALKVCNEHEVVIISRLSRLSLLLTATYLGETKSLLLHELELELVPA